MFYSIVAYQPRFSLQLSRDPKSSGLFPNNSRQERTCEIHGTVLCMNCLTAKACQNFKNSVNNQLCLRFDRWIALQRRLVTLIINVDQLYLRFVTKACHIDSFTNCFKGPTTLSDCVEVEGGGSHVSRYSSIREDVGQFTVRPE